MNVLQEPLREFPFQTAEDNEELLHSVNHHKLLLRISGSLAVGQTTAGSSNGTPLSQPISRLIERVRIIWDGTDIVAPVNGRDLEFLYPNLVPQIVATTLPPTFDGTAQAAAPFEQFLIIPFARPYLRNPWETIFPIVRVNQQFRLYVKWNTGASNSVAGSTPGSGAFISGGDRSVELSNVKLDVLQHVSETPVKPWYIPVIRVAETRQYATAESKLPLKIRQAERYDSIALQTFNGDAAESYEDKINDVSFLHSSRRPMNRVHVRSLAALERHAFPAVAARAGRNFVMHADGGALGNVINPARLHEPTYEFNVDAPGTGSGKIRAILMSLMTDPRYTRVQR